MLTWMAVIYSGAWSSWTAMTTTDTTPRAGRCYMITFPWSWTFAAVSYFFSIVNCLNPFPEDVLKYQEEDKRKIGHLYIYAPAALSSYHLFDCPKRFSPSFWPITSKSCSEKRKTSHTAKLHSLTAGFSGPIKIKSLNLTANQNYHF